MQEPQLGQAEEKGKEKIVMFSQAEKQHIAAEVEKLLLSLNHPEMPKEKPLFELYVQGVELWSWARINPNWTFDPTKPHGVNPWNEQTHADISKNAPIVTEEFNKQKSPKNN